MELIKVYQDLELVFRIINQFTENYAIVIVFFLITLYIKEILRT